MGKVGLNWQFSGVGNFSGIPGASDMLLRNSNTGGLEVYDIAKNQITTAAFIGTVSLDWQFSGSALQVYKINNNQITGSASIGTVGVEWQFAGVAPIRAAGTSDFVLRNVNTGQFDRIFVNPNLSSRRVNWLTHARTCVIFS
jgi:hypothetical protein